jgi:hypothetical protein
MQIEVTCIEVKASDSCQRVTLVLAPPPPLPVVDGQNQPVKHSPPPVATLSVTVTSDERRGILAKIYPLEARAKGIRPELAEGDARKKELLTERAAVEKEIAGHRGALSRITSETRFEHGKKYVLTLTPKGAK